MPLMILMTKIAIITITVMIMIRITTIIILMKIRECKTQEKEVMNTTAFHYPQTDAQPRKQLAPFHITLSHYILYMMFYGIEYPSGQFRSAVLSIVHSSFLGTCLLAENGTLKSP